MTNVHKPIATNQPAFPVSDGAPSQGLTKAEFFAAMAMHSLLLADKGISTDRLVIDAYSIGHAMAARANAVNERAKA